MNLRTRRRQVVTAIDMLMEVVEDVLREAQDNNEGGLTATTVAARAGFPKEGNPGGLARYVLGQLRVEGTAQNDKPGLGAGSWRLAH